MKCPNCKDKEVELLPARTREDRKDPDALKCPKCTKMFKMDDTNHLRPLDGLLERPAAPLALEEREPAVEEPPKTKPAGPPVPVKDEIDDNDKAEIFKRLVQREKPRAIATAVGCKPQAVTNFKFYHKKQIREAQHPAAKGAKVVDIIVHVEAETKPVKEETKKAKTETDPAVLEKKDSYSPAEKLIIIAEAKAGGFGSSEAIKKKYGLTKGQFRGFMLREDYYRQLISSGPNTIKGMRQHRSFIVSQVQHIDKVPLGKVRSLLEEYLKFLTDDLGPARGKVRGITLEMKRVAAAIEEFDLRTAACQEDVARMFKGGVECSNQKDS